MKSTQPINLCAFIRQPYCANTTNTNLCSHIWSICYMAQSLFGKSEIIAEPCLRKCPSGVNLQPTRPQYQRRIGKSYRYGYALNYGIPMGQSTPKTWFALIIVVCVLISVLFTVPLVRIASKAKKCLSVRELIMILAINDVASNLPNGMN